MRIRFGEPANPRYIHINQDTNTVQVLGPVTSGPEIGLDNTCKTVVALQEFFGKCHDSAQLENSARHELLRYRRALEDDLAVVQDAENRRLIADRLAQVLSHIETLGRIEAHHSLNSLAGGHPAYPQPLKELLNAPQSNLHSMVLRPIYQDGFLSTLNRWFTLDRTNTSNTFFHALQNVYPTIHSIPNTYQNRFVAQVMTSLHGQIFPITVSAILASVVDKLSTNFQGTFGRACDFNTDVETLGFLGFEIDEEITDTAGLETLVAGIITSKNAINPIFPPESAFNLLTMPNDLSSLSIMTQFLMAEINFYMRSKRMTSADFGQVLDGNHALAVELATRVKAAILAGASVEQAVCGFISTKRVQFGLTQTLPLADIDIIAQRFNSHYFTIKDSDHLDEFWLLDADHSGGFFSHQNGLCFDLSDLMQTPTFRELDTPFHLRARTEVARMPTVLPLRSEGAIATFDLDDEAVKAAVITAVERNDYNLMRRSLLSTLEDGRKVFQALGREFFAQFDSNARVKALFIRVRGAIKDAAVSNAFNQVVRGQDAQLLLTPEMARSLYVSAVRLTDLPKEMTSEYASVAAVDALLNHLRIANATVTQGQNGNFVIDTTADNVRALTASIETFSTAFHLTVSMSISLYKQVKERFGEASPEYIGMIALNNRENGPQKIIRALALLDVNFVKDNGQVVRASSTNAEDIAFIRSKILFPNNGRGTNGVVIQRLAVDSIRLIEGIHEFQAQRFNLTQDMARALYVLIGQQASAELNATLNGLSNVHRPDKIEAALALLGIQCERVEFNALNGFYCYLTEAEQAKIKTIAGIALTTDERALIPGYRPAIQVPDPKSRRGFLFDTIVQRARDARESDARAAPPSRFSRRAAAASAQDNAPAPVNVRIDRVAGFRGTPIPDQINPAHVQLTCPPHILAAFREMLAGSRVLGASFNNPYTNLTERFPLDAGQLTAKHLQILARNERVNVDGVMKTHLYNGLLTDNQIAGIRCLVKATTVAGITYATHVGGFPAGNGPATRLASPVKTGVIDMPGFQAQGDLRNTFGLFFYPDPANQPGIPEGYAQWQNALVRAMFGMTRPETPQANSINTVWRGVRGRIDLEGVAFGIEQEFTQALDAAVALGENLSSAERINFKFLKAGMGFFASGLGLNRADQARLEDARLQGILTALRKLDALPEAERGRALGRVGRIELPFSNNLATTTLRDIQAVLQSWGPHWWGGAGNDDALMPRAGWVNVTTNCGDPHAKASNEGGYQSVDAAISSNAYVDHINVDFNARMVDRVPTLMMLQSAPRLEQKDDLGFEQKDDFDADPGHHGDEDPDLSAIEELLRREAEERDRLAIEALTQADDEGRASFAGDLSAQEREWLLAEAERLRREATGGDNSSAAERLRREAAERLRRETAERDRVAAAGDVTTPGSRSGGNALFRPIQSPGVPANNGSRNTTIISKVDRLIANIRDKSNDRATWFTANTDSKTAKLQAIANWLRTHEMTPVQKTAVLAIIKEVCAIKRNVLGFFSPHSLTEFQQMLTSAQLDSIKNVHFSSRELKELGSKPNAVDELIQNFEQQSLRATR